ncbi:MAG: flavin reductase [Crocinitomicaceae bacterium]|nr:flavin reductase [Crocinitomicaceae bacterium]|tara:strand:- start:166 stop:1068 length:903 start_codon:yes stop_codon:yes gene_type:complete
MSHTSFEPKELNPSKLHSYLLGGVAPRPIAFASTIDSDGRVNLAPFSYFNVFSANPPVLIFSPARRGRDNTTKHTYENVLEVPEVVVNMVDYNTVHACSLASTEYDKGVNEFVKAGLTEHPSDLIKPPRVLESPVSFECKVLRVDSFGENPGAGQLVVCEIIKMHFRNDILNSNGLLDPEKIDLVGRVGGNFYVRASGDALFEVPKPLENLGIGVDKIPNDIRNSSVLSRKHLAILGNIEVLPNETEVNDFKLMELSEIFLNLQDDGAELELELHKHAVSLLENGDVNGAWKTLLSFNLG